MIKDILDGLKLVADGIESVHEIVKAVRSGVDYLKARHPAVQADVRALVVELRKSVSVIKQASAVLTNFCFAVDADVRGSELVRFNDYYIKSKTETQHLRDHIEDLRTHCSKVRDHALAIGKDANRSGFIALFADVLDLRDPAREQALSEKLDRLAFEDFAVANSAVRMLECLEASLAAVQRALGPAGSMSAANVEAAAAVLRELGPAFEAIEGRSITALAEVADLAGRL
jgi:hypothetical protein